MNGDGIFGPLDVDVFFRVIYPLLAASIFGVLFNLYSFPIPKYFKYIGYQFYFTFRLWFI